MTRFGGKRRMRWVVLFLAGSTLARCTTLRPALDGATDADRGDAVQTDASVTTDTIDATAESNDVAPESACVDDVAIVPHDGGACGSFPSTVCDAFANTGCPTGQRCAIVRWSSGAQVACLPPGVAREGDRCSTSADCESGLHCLASGPSPAVCVHACCAAYGDGDSYCSALAPGRIGSRCTVQTGSGIAHACTVPGDCDYLDPSSCPPRTECAPTSPYGQPQCVTPGHTEPGASCVFSSECVAGYTCATPPTGGSGICTPRCNPQNPCSFDPANCNCSQFNDRPVDFGSCI